MDLKRTGVVLKPNYARVLFRPFEQQDPQRSMRIVGRVMELSEPEVDALLAQVLEEFRGRHHRLDAVFSRPLFRGATAPAHRSTAE